MTENIVIIGGGAAGLMAAAAAAEMHCPSIILEPNRLLGKKLRITGKGRCNVTNNCDIKEFMRNVPRNGKFLYSALNAFSPSDTISFFENAGVPLKTERGRRVFPVSDSSHDIANALERLAHSGGMRHKKCLAKQIIAENGHVKAVLTSEGEVPCSAVVLATGGLSYPGTGSTGDGYRMARELGHTITDTEGSLVPLESDDDWCAELQGFSLKNVTLTAFDSAGKRIFSELGEMLFTHFGVSGPLVLSASAHMRNFSDEHYRLSIDLKPGLDEKKLDARILRDFDKYKNRDFANSLSDLAGHSMIPVLIRLSGIPGDTKVNSITRAQRQRLLELFKAFPVSISGPRPVEEAIITSGGISVREVDPRSMESKLCKGLFFAGEVLDLDAYTGGYNLQIAWSTARMAARSACTHKGDS